MCDHVMTLEEFAETYATPTITGYLIDVKNETHGPRTIKKGLKEYYALIGCRLIEMPTRQIGANRGRFHGRRYTIICDEEGLFADQPKISAIDNLGRPPARRQPVHHQDHRGRGRRQPGQGRYQVYPAIRPLAGNP